MQDIREIRRENANRIIRELYPEYPQKPGAQTKWAHKLGIQANVVSRYLTGKKGIGNDMARKMEKSAGKPANWMDQVHAPIVTGPGTGVTLIGNTKEGAAVRLNAPLLSWTEALDPLAAVARGATMVGEARPHYPCPVSAGSGTFTLRVHGVSMEPDFRDGDLIFVDPNVPPTHQRFVIARVRGSSEALLRRLILEGGRSYLQTSNRNWPDGIIEVTNDVTIVGTVIFRGNDV